jgi:translation initiation factor 2-alpha kinase 4
MMTPLRESQDSTNGVDYSKSTGGLDFISSSGYPKIEFGSDGESDEDDDGAIVFGSDSGKLRQTHELSSDLVNKIRR